MTSAIRVQSARLSRSVTLVAEAAVIGCGFAGQVGGPGAGPWVAESTAGALGIGCGFMGQVGGPGSGPRVAESVDWAAAACVSGCACAAGAASAATASAAVRLRVMLMVGAPRCLRWEGPTVGDAHVRPRRLQRACNSA